MKNINLIDNARDIIRYVGENFELDRNLSREVLSGL